MDAGLEGKCGVSVAKVVKTKSREVDGGLEAFERLAEPIGMDGLPEFKRFATAQRPAEGWRDAIAASPRLMIHAVRSLACFL